jgi:A/G-specific adenine glycosylase
VSESLIAAKAGFQRELLAWYDAYQRPLPWRTQPSLYRTVVSEFMLQQTQVKTMLPYFARWMCELPDFPALAAADGGRVLKLWEGLGYYTRARNLHRLAQRLVASRQPPETPEAWQELPGIGPYTAAAITSITYGAPIACVDGNVVRILARVTADATPYRDSATASRALAPLAQALLPVTRPGDHNQAMMELGATVCLRRAPLCTICPVRTYCAAARTGEAEAFPRLAAKVIERQSITRIWSERNGSLLLHRASAGARRLADLHELPRRESVGLTETAVAEATVLAMRRRSITRFAIVETIVRADVGDEAVLAMADELVWVPLDRLDGVTLSGPHRRWVSEILAGREG